MPVALTIRRAAIADLPSLTSLERTLFREMAYPYAIFRQIADTHGSNLHVAEMDKTVVGYAMAVPAEDGVTAWLWSMGVIPSHRRQGVARQLMVHAMEVMINAGVKRLLLTVEPDNHPAITLYKSLDFQQGEVVRDYFGVNEDRIVMQACL